MPRANNRCLYGEKPPEEKVAVETRLAMARLRMGSHHRETFVEPRVLKRLQSSVNMAKLMGRG